MMGCFLTAAGILALFSKKTNASFCGFYTTVSDQLYWKLGQMAAK